MTGWRRREVLVGAATLAVGASAVASAANAQQPLARDQETSAPTQTFVFIYRAGPAWRPGVPMREQGLASHGAYIRRLRDEGRVFAAGGFENGDGGLAVVLAANFAEAEAMLAADPAIVAGIFVADVRQWRPRFRGEMALP